MGENQPLILTYGADAKALDAAMNRSLTKVLATMDKMEARVSAFEKKIGGMGKTFSGGKVVNEIRSIEEAFARVGRTDAGNALANVFDRSRLAVLETGSAKIPIFGSALEHLGPQGLAAAAGIAAAAVAIEGALKFTEKAAEIERTAKALGMTTTQVQEFAHVASALNIAPDKLNESLASLQATLGNLESGLIRGKQLREFTEHIGIGPEALRSWGTLQEQLPHVLDALAKLNTEERAGAAKRLKIDPEVLNSLIEGRSRITDLIGEAHRYGLVIDADVVKKGAEANEKLKVAGDIIRTNLTVAFADLAPVIVSVANAIAGATRSLNDFIQSFKAVEDRNATALQDRLKTIQAIQHQRLMSMGVAQTFKWEASPEYQALQSEKAQIEGTLSAKTALEAAAAKDASGAPATQIVDTHHNAKADHSATAIDDAEVRYIEALIRGAKDLDEAHQLRLKLIEAQYALALAHAAQEKKPETRAKLGTIAGLTHDADVADENQRYAKAQGDHEKTFTDELARLQEGQLSAQADITGRLQDRQAAERRRLADEQDQAAADLANRIADDKAFQTASGREEGARLISAQAAEFLAQLDAQHAKQAREVADHDADVAQRNLGFDNDRLKALEQLAHTQAQRRALAQQLLDNERKQAELALEKQYRDDPAALAAAKGALGLTFQARQGDLDRQFQGPLARFAGDNDASGLGDSLQTNAVSAMREVNSGLSEAIVNGKSLHDVLRKALLGFGQKEIEQLLGAGESSLLKALHIGGAGGGGPTSPLDTVNKLSGAVQPGGGGGGLMGLLKAGLGFLGLFGFQGGGEIPGSGRGDKVPILAEPGERMIRNGPSQRYAPFLDAINAGQPLRGYAMGGVIGGTAIPAGAGARGGGSLTLNSHYDFRGAQGDASIQRMLAAAHQATIAEVAGMLPDAVPTVMAQHQLQSGQ